MTQRSWPAARTALLTRPATPLCPGGEAKMAKLKNMAKLKRCLGPTATGRNREVHAGLGTISKPCRDLLKSTPTLAATDCFRERTSMSELPPCDDLSEPADGARR